MKFQTAIPIFVIVVLISNFINAKDKFTPAIQVDDMVITNYEIQQRSAFFELLKFPGNPKKEAENSLIDDRLKIRALIFKRSSIREFSASFFGLPGNFKSSKNADLCCIS